MKKINLGILGPKGSYSQQVSFQYSNKNNHILFDSINDVIQALSSNKIEEAILPLENSIHGTVLETLDGLHENKLKINQEIIFKIEHCLIGLNNKIPSSKIKNIYSHPQALGQCKIYLQTKYPKAKLISTSSTSAAIKKIKDDGKTDSLAIGSKFATNLYNLSIIDENIQDTNNNQTLFVVVSKKGRDDLPFTFLVIEPKTDKSGILYEILSIFKKEDVNLSKIESRPSKKRLGNYIFYIKADISSKDKKRVLILKELKKMGKIQLMTR